LKFRVSFALLCQVVSQWDVFLRFENIVDRIKHLKNNCRIILVYDYHRYRNIEMCNIVTWWKPLQGGCRGKVCLLLIGYFHVRSTVSHTRIYICALFRPIKSGHTPRTTPLWHHPPLIYWVYATSLYSYIYDDYQIASLVFCWPLLQV